MNSLDNKILQLAMLIRTIILFSIAVMLIVKGTMFLLYSTN